MRVNLWKVAVTYAILFVLIKRIHGFCSAYCDVGSCASDDVTCTGCVSPFTYNASASPTCQTDSTTTEEVVGTEGSGLTLDYGGTSHITCGSLTVHGWLDETDTATIDYGGGSKGHLSYTFMLWVVVTGDWTGGESININIDGTNVQQRAFSSYDDSTTNYCSSNETQYYYRIQTSWAHTSNNAVSIQVSLIDYDTGSPSTAQWALNDPILVVKNCHDYCSQCSGTAVNECTQCETGYYYLNTDNTCYVSCPQGYFEDGSLCSGCDDRCVECTNSSTNCQSCTENGTYQSYLDGSSCVDGGSCSTSTYPDNTTHVCEDCNSSCQECSDLNDCTDCISSLYLLGTVCYSDCPSTYYEDPSGDCKSCESKCTDCTNATQCTSCATTGADESYLDNGDCVDENSCTAGTYAEVSTHTCDSCNSSCATCEGDKDNCTSCEGVLYYLSNVCYAACPTGYYQSANDCLACDDQCTECDSSGSNCSACTTTGAHQSFLDGSSCVDEDSCTAGTYAQTSTHTCDSCNSSCATCSMDKDNCTSCDGVLYYLSNICYTACPTGYYQSANDCLACDDECTQCDSSSSNCSACTTSGAHQSFLDGSSCVDEDSCTNGYYAQVSTHVCQSCNSSCATCSMDKDNCTSCDGLLYYLSNVCYAACPTGYYQSANDCLACDDKCTECDSSSSNCSACTTSGAHESFLDGSQCVDQDSCTAGTYAETSTHVCEACNTSCSTCEKDKDNCTGCVSSLYYLSNVCYSDCPVGYFQHGSGECRDCYSRCTQCDIQSTNCSACVTSGALESFLDVDGSSCVSSTSCTSGYYGETSTHTCEPCDNSTSCQTCYQAATNCTSCISPQYLLNNVCYDTCPGNYYGSSGYCYSCHSYCYECWGSNVDECTVCDDSGASQAFLLDGKQCVTQCPNGTFHNYTTHVCDICDVSCTECTGNPTPCSACNQTYSYFNDTCYDVCPDGMYSHQYANITYYICQSCSFQCLTCYGPSNKECYTCQYDYPHILSGTTCSLDCLSGYGYTDDVSKCVRCHNRCTSCYNNQHNCSGCVPSGGKKGYMLYNNQTLGTGRCYKDCPDGYFKNQTSQTCDLCHSNCTKCEGIDTKCTQCRSGLYLLDNFCYDVCPDRYFQDGTNCSACLWRCMKCEGNSWNCTQCNPDKPAYYLNMRCLLECPVGYYQSDAMNYTCQLCNQSCVSCDDNPSPCYQCVQGYYLFNNVCYDVCPDSDYFEDITTKECLSIAQYCIDTDVTIDFGDSVESSVVLTVQFDAGMDFESFPYETFQTVTFDDAFFTLDMFTFTYQVLSNTQYQMTITPSSYIFMKNVQVTITTNSRPTSVHTSIKQRPVCESIYSQSYSIKWSVVVSPQMPQSQKDLLQFITNQSKALTDWSSDPVAQQFIKTGLISWIFPGVQITSSVLLVNNVIPRNLYEGIRVMAIFVLFHVPDWEKDADSVRYVFLQPIEDILPSLNTRLLSPRLLTTEQNWRFERTGWSTFFAVDTYTQIFLIIFSWIILGIVRRCYRKDPYNKNVGRAYTFFHKAHEIAIFYLTITTILEWIYFDSSTWLRWVSFFLCILMMVYFLIYEVYMYYDMLQYPTADLGTRSYLYYCTKYGSFLSKIRYQEYNINEEWSPKVWFRPYYYHFLSYYKKILMMCSLPLFHNFPHAQIGCLILLQLFEICRFCITWPYATIKRNVYKLAMEIVLLLIFVVVLVLGALSTEMMMNNPSTIEMIVSSYNTLGWIGLILVLFFNFSILLMMIVDLCSDCWAGGNISRMDQIRREFYWQKVHKYEEENQDIDHQIVGNWIKLGNLTQKQHIHEKSKLFKIKIEQLRVQKLFDYFSVTIDRVSDLRIKKEGFLIEESKKRLYVRDKLHRVIEVTKNKQPKVFEILQNIYQSYELEELFRKAKQEEIREMISNRVIRHTYETIIETWLQVDMTKYENGGRIVFYRDMLQHRLSIFLNGEKIDTINEKHKIEGLPIDTKLIS